MTRTILIFLGISILLSSCQPDQQDSELFVLLNNQDIGIDFINQLEYDREFNVYKYRNYYNGGGVSLGDVNNDDLIDIYFTGNLKKNRLYLNRGNHNFEDVTKSAGVGGTRSWSTGVTMVDINADGHLDIYVCNSGDIKGDNKENELFINQGDGTFQEMAEQYGLNDSGFSTHASFFDYDKDGDLDVYLLNNSYRAIGSFNLRTNERPKRDVLGGDKLLRNDGEQFTDASEASGIYGSVIGFGLGVTVGDVNNDSWEDIYVSNDFFERDYLYLNQQDGTFKEVLTEQMSTISGASMGADMADINNDGHADIFVTEMLPSDPERLKSVTTFEDWNKYQYNLTNGYHHQFTRNTLQYNNGDGSFSELGRYAGVEASDWSWGALFFDMDNDGLKDLFIANGIYQDLTNQDYLQYVANEQVIKSIISDDGVNYKELIDIIPSNPIPNHFYQNLGDLSFQRIQGTSIDQPSFSNGAAYGDLDNDGDYDLVVNNVNMPPFIYENKSNELQQNNYLKLVLEGGDKNPGAIGSKIIVSNEQGDQFQFQHQPARGFQSSMDPAIICGVAQSTVVDIEVLWPDLSRTVLNNQDVNQVITIRKDQRAIPTSLAKETKEQALFRKSDLLDYVHEENAYSDFNRERLIYHMKSNLGPQIASGDIDDNGTIDFVLGGPKGSNDIIAYQLPDGKYRVEEIALPFSKERETSDVHLFDANGDGHLDLYLASGGVDVSPFSPHLFDKLLINDGSGNFSDSGSMLPNGQSNISSSVVQSCDFDQDGDLDLFIGERVKIGSYGAPCSGFILQNDGTGNFIDVTAEIAPELMGLGMINDAEFVDLDEDEQKELVIVGEFMWVEVFQWNGEQWKQSDILNEIESGWNNVIHSADINGDGLSDLIVGNHGLNSRFKASKEQPIKLVFNDFDQNGFPEGILTYAGIDGRDYPYALRHNLIDQLKYLKGRFPDYASYKNSSIDEVFNDQELETATILIAEDFSTKILINRGDGSFENIILPKEGQFTPIYAVATEDFDRDGDLDILMGGNQFNVLPEAGIYDASFGIYLQNNGNEIFQFIPNHITGMKIDGQVRDIYAGKGKVLVARNNERLLTYKY